MMMMMMMLMMLMMMMMMLVFFETLPASGNELDTARKKGKRAKPRMLLRPHNAWTQINLKGLQRRG
eukprot:610580-Karenia_brevis.AAC.1